MADRAGGEDSGEVCIRYGMGRRTPFEKCGEKAGVEIAGLPFRVGEEAFEKSEIRDGARDDVFGESAAHASGGGGAIGRPDGELGEERVIFEGDGPAGIDAAIHAHAGARWFVIAGDGAGTRKEVVFRIFGINAAFESGAGPANVLLTKSERLPGGNANLPVDEIDAGDPFGNGVFDLEAGVHFEEIEVAVLVGEELEGAGIRVIRGASDFEGGLADAVAELGMGEHEGRRRFLDDFLMASLDGAFALAEMDQVAVLVAEDLNFNVARAVDPFFEIDFTGTEGALRFTRSGTHGGGEIGFAFYEAHAFAAAAGRGFEKDGVADLGGELGKIGLRSRDDGGSGSGSELASGGFRPHLFNGLPGGPDEFYAGFGTGAGKFGVFAEKAVAGMNGVGAGEAGGIEDPMVREIAFRRGSGPDGDRFVGHLHVERAAIGFGKDGDAWDAEFAESAEDADGDLAAVRDQDFLEHRSLIVVLPNELGAEGKWPPMNADRRFQKFTFVRQLSTGPPG